MFLDLLARSLDLHVDKLSSCGSLGQRVRTFFVGVPHVSVDPMHMALDINCFNKALNLSYHYLFWLQLQRVEKTWVLLEEN